MTAEDVQLADLATVMTSSGQNQSEIHSERAATNTRSVDIESYCTYPNERRERNQIYTLLSISSSVNEREERPLECVSGTGWEEAVKYIMRKTRLDESQVGIMISGRNINNLRYEDDTNLMAESEEELKDRLDIHMVKEESTKVALKHNIKKTKIMASGPLNFWQIDGEEMEVVTGFIFLGSKVTTDGDCSQEFKRRLLLGRKAMAKVQSWSKAAPFAYLQLQKRARKTRTSESVGGCLYCLDLMQVVDKGLEQDPKTIDQLKSDCKFSTNVITDSVPEKQELYSNTNINTSSATDDTTNENCYGKTYSIQTSQIEMKKLTLKEAQASLSERIFFPMKDNLLFQAEKKTVPIKEYNMLPSGKPQSIEILKYKDTKSHEPFVYDQVGSESTAVKPSLLLPPLKETAFKNSLDPPSKKSKTLITQASEKTFCPVSETMSCTQVFKIKEEKYKKRIDTMYDAVKEQIKMHEMSCFVPRLPKTSFITRNSDQCYWHCALLPDRNIATMSNSIALRRHNHLNNMRFLHAKGMQVSKTSAMQDPCIRSRSHTGTKQGNESKTQEIPLLSGLFPSLTEQGWGRATPFSCCMIPKRYKKPRITKMISSMSHQSMVPSLKKNAGWVTQLAKESQKMDCKFTEQETVSSNKKNGMSCIKPYRYVPMMTASAEGERMRGKLDSIQTFLGEKRSLPIKEYEIKYSQQHREPEVLRYNDISLPKVTRGNPSNSLNCITLNAFLVIRPDKEGVIKLHLEPPSNNDVAAVKRTEKGDKSSTKTVSRSHAAKKKKNEKKVDESVLIEKADCFKIFPKVVCHLDKSADAQPMAVQTKSVSPQKERGVAGAAGKGP
ncbi:hypothetical protein EYD10_10816 [Varanus komodoensis]|nr:hypothetical protein EYD10_10816 [Varanus komodoensis]